MKNLRRVFAVLVVVTMLVTAMIPASAASTYSYSAEAQKLYDLGLYKGVSTTTFDPDLGSQLTREQGVAMLLRLLGKEPAALALTDNDVNLMLMIFSDKDQIQPWAKKYVAYGIMYKMINGYPDGTFRPQGELLGKEFCKMLLAALGYTVDGPIFDNAAFYLSQYSKLSYNLAAKINDKAMIRDDLVGVAYAALNAKYKADGKTVIKKLVESNVITEAQAIASGAYNDDLYAMADAAVKAYEAKIPATLATIADCDATDSLKAAADAAVAKVQVAADKTALQKRIDAQASAIAARKATLQAAIDADTKAKADAEAAVAAYENATIAVATVTADIANADSLKKAAEEKVNLVNDASARIAFLNRIADQKAKLDARIADVNNIIAATTAVNNYVAAPYSTLDQIAAAEKLEADASAKVAVIVDAAAKADLSKKIADQKALVAAKKVTLTPAVATVKIDNFKTIVATFSKKMVVDNNTPDSAVKVAVNNGSPVSSFKASKLSEDGRTLVIPYTGNVADTVKVTIEGLKDEFGIEMAKCEVELVARDVTDPVFSSYQVLSNKRIKVFFSEPMNLDTKDVYMYSDQTNLNTVITVDGNYTFVKLTPVVLENAAIIEFQNALSNGSHTIVIKGARDFAGFKAADIAFNVNTAADTTAPVPVSVVANSIKEIVINFDEEINVDTGTIEVKETGSDVAKIISKREATSDGKGIKITLDDNNTLSFGALLGFTVKVKDIENTSGLKCGELTISGKLADDITPPSIVSYSILDNDFTKMRLAFNEPVDILDPNNTDVELKLFEKGKVDVKATMTQANIEEDTASGIENAYIVTINYLSGKDPKDYDLVINGISDMSARHNPMVATKITFRCKDDNPPTFNQIIHFTADDEKVKRDKFEIIFSEPMDTSTITNINNYFVGYADSNGKNVMVPVALQSGASVQLVSTSRVIITVPLADENQRYDRIALLLAKDASGKLMNPSLAGASIATPYVVTDTDYRDFTVADLKTAEITGPNTIKITVANAAYHTFLYADPRAFGIEGYTGTTPAIVAAQISSDFKTLTLTTSVTMDAYGNYNGVPVKVTVDSTKGIVKDQNQKVLASGSITTTDKIAPVQQAFDKSKDLVKRGDGLYYYTIRFNEAVTYASALSGLSNTVPYTDARDVALANGIEVVYDGKVKTAGYDYCATIEDGKVVIRFDKLDNMDKLGSVKIKRADYIVDLKGNTAVVLQ